MARSYSIIGLGKLGASMAAALASRGHRVVGVDTNPAVVQAVLSGRAPVEEPGLAEMLAAHGSRVTATMDAAAAVRDTDVTFVVVPTPSEPEGGFSIAYARAAMAAVGAGLRDKAGYHLVVMTSTVLPGATRHGLIPVLEEASGRRAGEDFGVCYSPEFIALGSVIRDFLNPDFTLVGELDPRSGATLEACYAEVLENGAPCRRMTLENAELAKIALNTFVTTKITFANMLADLCERLPGGDVDVVADALGLDGRIGRRYLTGATSYGGPCFPRDNQALSFLARALGTSAEMAETTDRLNRQEVERLLRRIGRWPGCGRRSWDWRTSRIPPWWRRRRGSRSPGHWRRRVRGCGPGTRWLARRRSGRWTGAAEVAGSLADCLAEAELVVVTTADPAFRGLGADDFAPGATIHDAWRILTHLADAPNVRYVAVGRGATELENQERLANLWSEPVETA
jgi:UDPglucose 6-dehydrogenase